MLDLGTTVLLTQSGLPTPDLRRDARGDTSSRPRAADGCGAGQDQPLPDRRPIRDGVDDGAVREGGRQGTIMGDRHRVTDLLRERTATTLAGRLERHADIGVIARPRMIEAPHEREKRGTRPRFPVRGESPG